MDTEVLGKEQRFLRQIRMTLGNVVKDATPVDGRALPLTESTIKNIQDCYVLISDRERELAGKLNIAPAMPSHADAEQPTSGVVSFVKLSKNKR